MSMRKVSLSGFLFKHNEITLRDFPVMINTIYLEGTNFYVDFFSNFK